MNPRHFIPFNVEVTILSTQAIQRTQCTINVIDISPWLTRRKSNKRLTCKPLVQSERSVAEVGGPAREDMTEVTAMFCNSVCIPPLQYLPFAWFCMWGKCHCSLTVPCLLSIRQAVRPFVFHVCNHHSRVCGEMPAREGLWGSSKERNVERWEALIG